MQSLLLLFCLFLFACKKDLNPGANGVKPGNTEMKQGGYKSFSTNKQTQAAISLFIQDSVHDFKTLDNYLSRFLDNKFNYVATRPNAASRIQNSDDPNESDDVYSNSWSNYYNESGDFYGGIDNEYEYASGNNYSLAVFEGIAYGTSTFQKRHNTIVINFPYAYRVSANTRRYLYSLADHNVTATLTGPALGELEYVSAYAFNPVSNDHGTYDGQLEGFVNIREKRTRIIDDEFNILFKAGLKAEIFEVGTELEGGRKVQIATNTVGDYSINLLLQLLTPQGAAANIVEWTYWGEQYAYPKPTYYLYINGINVGYQQN